MLRNYLSNDTGADRLAALADGESQPLLHRNRRNQLHHNLDVVPRHHHLGALRQLHRPRHIRGAKIKLRPIPLEERRVPPSFVNTYTSASNFVCGLIEPGLHNTCPRSTSSRFVPRSNTPTLSPACPSSRSLRNISTPVHVVFCVGRIPTISTSSFTFTMPRSMRPVTTVPRPAIENTSSTGIKNAPSTARFGTGM